MKLQQLIPLSDIYNREEEFSEALADNLDALNFGEFEDVKTEFNVNRRRADIFAVGVDGVLVVENQFGEANWDHWGRLEAYARSRNATIAALVAESFEDLMIVTCNRRNEESNIDWYLIQVQVNSHEEFSFHHVARPAIGIQIGQVVDVEYREFWQPIRDGEFGELFVGKPVPTSKSYIDRPIQIRGVNMRLYCRKRRCYVRLQFNGDNRFERRDDIMELFPKSEYKYEDKDREGTKDTLVVFHVLDKGENDQDDWDEIREKLVSLGTDIYNKISESNL